MTIVLNEHEWAEEMISSGSLGKKPIETLCRVARYYIDEGMSKQDTKKYLTAFIIKCDPSAAIPKWNDAIDRSIAFAMKHEAIMLDGVVVTKKELKEIDKLQGKQVRRLAFTLLCLAKYWNAVNKNGDSWVNNKDSDIMKMANIRTSTKRQSAMYHSLNEAGLIRFSRRVDNTNVQVCFVDDGDRALMVTDFRNLGYQYLMYHGEPYFVCSNCGITARVDKAPTGGRPPKYCRECAAQISMRQHVNRIMRERSKSRAAECDFVPKN